MKKKQNECFLSLEDCFTWGLNNLNNDHFDYIHYRETNTEERNCERQSIYPPIDDTLKLLCFFSKDEFFAYDRINSVAGKEFVMNKWRKIGVSNLYKIWWDSGDEKGIGGFMTSIFVEEYADGEVAAKEDEAFLMEKKFFCRDYVNYLSRIAKNPFYVCRCIFHMGFYDIFDKNLYRVRESKSRDMLYVDVLEFPKNLTEAKRREEYVIDKIKKNTNKGIKFESYFNEDPPSDSNQDYGKMKMYILINLDLGYE